MTETEKQVQAICELENADAANEKKREEIDSLCDQLAVACAEQAAYFKGKADAETDPEDCRKWANIADGYAKLARACADESCTDAAETAASEADTAACQAHGQAEIVENAPYENCANCRREPGFCDCDSGEE